MPCRCIATAPTGRSANITMTIPYEILIRGKANGTLSGCHAVTAAGGAPRTITAEDLADLAPEINAAALARVAELGPSWLHVPPKSLNPRRK